MKKLRSLVLLLALYFISGCDNSTGPTEPKIYGETTINSKVVNFTVTGFSFNFGGPVTSPNHFNVTPDFFVLVEIIEGNINGVFFAPGGEFKPTFKRLMSFETRDSAQIYFNNLSEVPDSNYNELALPVKENQIWAVKTVDGKFGKILIINTEAYNDSSTSLPTPYGEATFEWKYQPDGSRYF